MAVECFFDNPVTQQREAWRDGELVEVCPREELHFTFHWWVAGKIDWSKTPPWRDGQVRGDKVAMTMKIL